MASGLLCVDQQFKSGFPEADFHDWYDSEHGPARLKIPGFINGTRYCAIDEKEPKWLTSYDLSTVDAALGAEYKALSANPTARDREIIQHLQSVTRSVYNLINTVENDPTATYPAPVALIVTFRVQPELQAEFNSWYDTEHLALLSKVAGFRRARRYKLVDSAQAVGPPDSERPHNYLAFYDVDGAEYTQHPDFNAALETPLSVKMLKTAEALEIRLFAVHNLIQPK